MGHKNKLDFFAGPDKNLPGCVEKVFAKPLIIIICGARVLLFTVCKEFYDPFELPIFIGS